MVTNLSCQQKSTTSFAFTGSFYQITTLWRSSHLNRGFRSPLNLVINQLFSHQEEANSGKFLLKIASFEGSYNKFEKRIKEVRKAPLLSVTLSKCIH